MEEGEEEEGDGQENDGEESDDDEEEGEDEEGEQQQFSRISDEKVYVELKKKRSEKKPTHKPTSRLKRPLSDKILKVKELSLAEAFRKRKNVSLKRVKREDDLDYLVD